MTKQPSDTTPVEVCIITKDHEIKGTVYVSKFTKSNRELTELLNDKEKTIATSHDKIMIAKVRKYNFADIEYTISHIINNAEDGNIHDMIYEIKTLIPEYVSANSEYELIDKEIDNLKK